MPLREIFRRNIERGEIEAIDEILRRQFVKTDGVRAAVPMEVHSPSASRVQPFNECAGESRAIALMDLRKPDENIRALEKLAQRIEFLIR